MRRLAVTLFVLGALAACEVAGDAGDDACARAARTFASCGASLPLLSGGACTGLRKAVATCVTENATTCDELATLFRRLDACADAVLDAGEPLVPPSDLPVAPSQKAEPAPETDATSDDPPKPSDAGVFDAGHDAAADAGTKS